MPLFSTPAVLLRRIEHGDYDLILSFFTLSHGRKSAIAKSAKKSTKRFAGVLEPFSQLRIVYRAGKGSGLPVLQEASLQKGFAGIRGDLMRTAYASYWAQLIHEWTEEGQPVEALYHLFGHVLTRLDEGTRAPEAVSILFQMRFLTIAGLAPDLFHCRRCRQKVEEIKTARFILDLSGGGLLCEGCGSMGGISMSKGTIRQLQWLQHSDMKKADRIRFAPEAVQESVRMLEAFVPFHLGREPKSLKFLKQIRGG